LPRTNGRFSMMRFPVAARNRAREKGTPPHVRWTFGKLMRIRRRGQDSVKCVVVWLWTQAQPSQNLESFKNEFRNNLTVTPSFSLFSPRNDDIQNPESGQEKKKKIQIARVARNPRKRSRGKSRKQ
jgi:hypothetical protein